MKRFLVSSMMLWMPLLPAVVTGDQPPATMTTTEPADEGAPARAAFGISSTMSSAPMPPGRIDNMPVETYLAALKKWLPELRYIVHREKGCTGKGPILPTMETTELKFGEFVNFVNSNCPGVHITPDDSQGPFSPLYVVELSNLDATDALPPPSNLPVVKVYSLNEVIAVQRSLHKTEETAAMNDVLSLIQTMIDESPGGKDVTLKVHQPTNSLVFKGPAPLAAVVQDALASIVSGDRGASVSLARRTAETDDLRRENQELKTQLEQVRIQNRGMVSDMTKLSREAEEEANRRKELENRLLAKIEADAALPKPAK